jgi:hypothetical protein
LSLMMVQGIGKRAVDGGSRPRATSRLDAMLANIAIEINAKGETADLALTPHLTSRRWSCPRRREIRRLYTTRGKKQRHRLLLRVQIGSTR